jgi:hypothetical protein
MNVNNSFSVNNTVSKIVICAALIILALVSFFPLAKSFPDSGLYDGTVKACTASIDEKTATVLRLTATATVTSAGLSAIPGDTATPIAEKLADFSEYFLLILCVLYAEKYLLAIIPAGVFRLLVPLACLAFLVGTLRSSRRWTVQGGKLLLVGLLLLCVIPVSLKISDAIYDRFQESINVTISNAEELSETADELVQAQEDQGLFDKILGTIKETTGGLTQRAADTLNRFVEAMAVMIVTSCVIPILVLLFFVWVVKQLTGVDLRDFAPRRPRREQREEEKETQQRVSI